MTLVPTSSRGSSLPSQWAVAADGGLEITSTSAGSDFADLVEFLAAGGASPWVLLTSGDGHHRFNQDGSNFIWAQVGGDRPGNIIRVREYDVIFYNQASSGHLLKIDRDNNALGFFNHAAATQPTVAGAKLPADVVMASLLTALSALGLVVDTTT